MRRTDPHPNSAVIATNTHTPRQDLARNVGREVAKIDCCNMAPQVYGYVSRAQPVRGAFGATGATMQRARLERVDIPCRPNQGLFSEA